MKQETISTREKPDCTVVVDHSHVGRRASGIERVTRELFSGDALTPLRSRATPQAQGALSMVIEQWIANPARAILHPRDIWIFPGYPPSPLFVFSNCTKVLYVHDLFLLTRWSDLNWSAKLYMALPFRLAIRTLRYFFVNSLMTAQRLASIARPGAHILPLRPAANNVFDLGFDHDPATKSPSEAIFIGALGTVEPRKNFIAAASIVGALEQRLQRKVELHIIGRRGWGKDYEVLKSLPHVRLHGFVPDARMAELTARWDLFLCTSHDEGLGLPLLEMQHSGLPIIAPDQQIFHEVLGVSGTYIHTSKPESAAARVAELINQPDRVRTCRLLARENIARWNRLAEQDKQYAITFLSNLCRTTARNRLAPNH